ncbi:zf-DHHC-domain-containing protein [Zopfia rhizophila CBS 207.26]|uniref:Palmitoyltransferase PFA4 n=1 Tax=Zopfia rhizophila CBS 207.26 TaxID=1314779 RepID=A0A6A6E4W0_9PEZI|nr:zf-DHHC-domain-containing protein [Zopfia rhizophila CBS 207.26]
MELSSLSVPSVYLLISFLAYSSQWLCLYLEPHPLERKHVIRLNVILVCLLISYTRSIYTNPGQIPKKLGDGSEDVQAGRKTGGNRQRWCRKCDAVKPPRAHHCKECKRCIPKMDHHCPWTSNCVSHTTFPHFLRFLFYAVVSMIYVASCLWTRCVFLWENRHLPSYLGPSAFQLAHLFLLFVINLVTLFALSILLIRNIWCLAVNTTTIEGWEIERHEKLVQRAKYFGGYLDGPDGIKVRIQKQEFPYDIGIWQNFKQGMGTGNIVAWLWPLSATPPIETGLGFETNGFEDPSLSWPPPDPDRLQRRVPHGSDKSEAAFTYRDANLSAEETLAAFRRRQEADMVRRRKPFVQRVEAQVALEKDNEEDEYASDRSEGGEGSVEGSESGEEGWKNSEGERLRDFGVDEDVEFYDEDEDVPLSKLLARKMRATATQ